MDGQLRTWPHDVTSIEHLLERCRREAKVGDQGRDPLRGHLIYLHTQLRT
jgi:hypothetical protein